METIYTIHQNYDHCKVFYNGNLISFNNLKNTFRKRIIYLSRSISRKSIVNEDDSISFIEKDFKKSKLSENEYRSLVLEIKKSKAKTWLSHIRALRRKGKLENYKIDLFNKRGMVWNPKDDYWEAQYLLLKNNYIKTLILKVKDYNSELWIKDLNKVYRLYIWENKQRELYEKNQIVKENLDRLNFVNFNFKDESNIFFKPINDFHEMNLFDLNKHILFIEDLKLDAGIGGKSDRAKFIKKYGLKNQDNYIGSSVKISESRYLALNKYSRGIYNLSVKKQINNQSNKEKIFWEKIKEKGLKKVRNIQIEDFKKEIEKISNKIVRLSASEKKTYNDKDQKQLIYDRYQKIYSELENFLKNLYPYQEKNKGVIYSVFVKYNFNDGIKLLVSNNMIEILDKHLLKTGNLNHKKTFKPISFLLSHYTKKKNLNGLNTLKEFIDSHQILHLIYSDRVKKAISKC